MVKTESRLIRQKNKFDLRHENELGSPVPSCQGLSLLHLYIYSVVCCRPCPFYLRMVQGWCYFRPECFGPKSPWQQLSSVFRCLRYLLSLHHLLNRMHATLTRMGLGFAGGGGALSQSSSGSSSAFGISVFKRSNRLAVSKTVKARGDRRRKGCNKSNKNMRPPSEAGWYAFDTL